jgi:hypothetical protein
MNNIKAYSQIISKAKNNNRLAVFVGSGISSASDLPSWSKLIDELVNDLELTNGASDFLKVAQLYYLEFGEHSYYEKIKKYFPSHTLPNLIHEYIFKLEPQYIITTNWDDLLEKEIRRNAHIYDVISSDKDLVKSSQINKLIKMHGDFVNHNIVFKEDDYLQYENNFPVISNYIKSIISTHTILFLGYSYSDFNLKQIVKWLQFNSTVSPPRFLLESKSKQSEINYLKNHGITTIVFNKSSDEVKTSDERTNIVCNFLNRLTIEGYYENPQTDDEVVNYIYSKLKCLDKLDFILFDQIKNVLSNCGFLFYAKDNVVLLRFYDSELTKDYNSKLREIHKHFINVIRKFDAGKYENEKLESIFTTLNKANIKGVVLSSDKSEGEYSDISRFSKYNSSKLDALMDFSYLNNKSSNVDSKSEEETSYLEYSFGNYEKAYRITERVIASRINKIDVTLFLAMFNRNLLLAALKSSFSDHLKYNKVEEYNLHEKFYSFPKDAQQEIKPVLDFATFDFFYRKFYQVNEAFRDAVKNNEIVKRGGYVFKSNVREYPETHANLVCFVLLNHVMIENFKEYKNLNKNFIEVAISRQKNEKIIFLNKVELFTSIKYMKNDDLLDTYGLFFADNEENNVKRLKISNNDKEWLLSNVLINLSDILDVTIESRNFENELANVISIISLLELNTKNIDDLIDTVTELISKSKCGLLTYQTLNFFLAVQNNVFGHKINGSKLVKLIEIILNKFIYRKNNGFENLIFSTGYLRNIFALASGSDELFKDRSLVQKFITELFELTDIDQKINIIQGILFNLYVISNPDVKIEIEEYITEEDLNFDDVSKDKELIYRLMLAYYGFSNVEQQLIKDIDNYISTFKDGKSFNTSLYPILDLLGKLDNKKTQSKKVFNEIKKIIENWKTKERSAFY